MLLKGKVALIVGSDDAIGKATAIATIEAGAKVILVSQEGNGGKEFTRFLNTKGEAIYQVANVTISQQLDLLFDRIDKEFGRLDIAFNNSAIAVSKGLLPQLDNGEVAEAIDINVYGMWSVMKYEIERMTIERGGAIVNNSGILGINALPTKSIESATKAAIVSLTKAAAWEYASHGIRINAIAPGFIETFSEHSNGKNQEDYINFVPMGRSGTPEEVAKAVVWLGSDEASFTTGHVFPLDGGFTSR